MSDRDDLSQLIDLAEGGNPFAQNWLGAKLATGDGVQQDLQQALYWYLKAANAGYTHAKWNAGSMLIDGEGDIAPNPELGMQLIEEAAQANESSACLFLAQCYRLGTHDKQVDELAAVALEERAWDTAAFREFDRK